MEELEEEKYIHNEHDKLFKRILDRTSEVESLIKKSLGINSSKKIEIQTVRNELTTRDYKGRIVDVLYKLKDKEVYFLIEHQSTQNPNMAYKIFKYETEIIDRSYMQNRKHSKKIAKVIKIVIFTGAGDWNVARSIVELQEEYGNKLKVSKYYEGLGEYKLIQSKNYSLKEIISEEGTLLGKAIIIEKARKEDTLIDVLEEIIPNVKEDEIDEMIRMIKYILVKDLGKAVASKYIKILKSKIKEEGGICAMVETMRALREDRRRTIMEANFEGKKAGILEGEKSGKIQAAKNMLKKNMDISLIEEITGLKREQFM